MIFLNHSTQSTQAKTSVFTYTLERPVDQIKQSSLPHDLFNMQFNILALAVSAFVVLASAAE